MGAHNNSVGSSVIQNATIVTTAETVVATSPPISLPFDSAQVVVLCRASVVVGTGGSFCNMNIRRGTSTAGALLTGTSLTVLGFVAGQTPVMTAWAFDTPANVAGQQYSFTLTFPATSGNTTVNDASIYVFIL